MKIKFISLLFAVFALFTMCNGAKTQNVRQTYNFNSEWCLFVGDTLGAEKPEFNDDAWKPVTLPHAWNEDEAFHVAINKLPTGIAWYRKQFYLPKADQGKKIFLEFEGIRQAGTVYVNGEKLILHENGVMAFAIDISSIAHFGDEANTVAVRTDNAWSYREEASGTGFQWNHSSFNVNYGGITKNVKLHVLPQVYQTLPLYTNLQTTGTYIYAQDIDVPSASASIHAESEVKNESGKTVTLAYEVEIKDLDNKTVAKFEGASSTLKAGEKTTLKANQVVKGLHFWSWGYGYLYTVTTRLKENGKLIDEVTTRTGFRKTGFGKGLITLNDRVIQVKGYAQRTTNEWPAVGVNLPSWISDYSNKLMVDNNANTVRWMHITPSKQDVESCDRVGLIQAMPAGDSEKDVKGRQWEQRKEVMRDAIIYNRNNPSILFYECGNESISYAHMDEMKAIRDQYDPFGGRAIGSREMLDIDNAEYGGEMLYINKSAKHPMWAMEYSRDEGLRKYWDAYSYPFHAEGDGPLYKNAPALEYNHNQDMMAIEDIRRWNDYYVERPGTGTRVSSGGVKIIFSDTNTHFRGEENYRRSGSVDPMRIAKDAFYVHRLMWNGWVDLEGYETYIIGHWNYSDTIVKDVYVVSGAPQVKLFLNGTALPEPERAYTFLHTFKQVAFKSGTLRAVSYDANGKELSSYTLETAGAPAKIKLTPMVSPNGMAADGSDLALIEVEVVDAEGRRCPLANDLISFTLSGPAEWRGGIAQGPDNYILAKDIPVECGVNRVFVRSTTEAGKITVTAKAEGLAPATIQLKTTAVKVENGLRTDFPSTLLPVNLDKGPTPSTPSFVVSRRALNVVSTQAGSNQENAIRSYDDNELSEWSNDGRVSTGWITYTLDRTAPISEVCIKLTGWRMRQYPLSVYVGDKLVWSGETERSLGYITLSFPEVMGNTVTLKLIGNTAEEDAFGSIVELSGNVELDLFRDPNAAQVNDQLRIVEVEFYERVK